MILREWKFEDIFKIAALERECFKGEAWTYGMLASSFENPNGAGIVAEEEGEITGYGCISCACDAADLENVAVAEPFRRCGTGRKIVEELIEKAKEKGVREVFLEVRVSNSAALGLYLSCGFVGTYARTRYYSDGEDCLVMKKVLG